MDSRNLSKFSPKFFRRPRQLGCQPRKTFRHHCKAPPVGLRRPPLPVGLRRPPPRDIEVVVESALSLVVLVSALWNRRVRCRFSPLRFGFFRHWTFVFCPTSRRAAFAAWASSSVLMRCHSFVGGARPTRK